MILVGYDKTQAYRLLNLMKNKIVMSRDIVIDENSSWDWNSGDAINKPLMSYGINEETDEVKVETVDDIPDTVKVEQGQASTIQRPQRTRVLQTRLQDYEMVGDDEVITNGELIHFALLAGLNQSTIARL